MAYGRRCRENKVKYPTFEDAQKSRKSMIKKFGDSGRVLKSYWCGICGAWHLGHPIKKKDVKLTEQFKKVEEQENG